MTREDSRDQTTQRLLEAAQNDEIFEAMRHDFCAQLGLKHSEFIRRKRGRTDFLSLERAEADQRSAEIRRADFRNNQD